MRVGMSGMKRRFVSIMMVLIIFLTTMADSLAAARLILPDMTEVISSEAFYGDTSLDEVVLSENTKRIEERAFAKSSVQRIYLPASVEYIAEDAFDGTNAVGWGKMGTYASEYFVRKVNLSFDSSIPAPIEDFELIYSPNGSSCTIMRYLGNDTKLIIPTEDDAGVQITCITRRAFEECDFLEEVIIPEGVTNIDGYAFYHCINLKNVTLPDSLKDIGEAAFLSCSSLKRINIPKGIRTIAKETFADCTSLEEVTLPEGLVSIGEAAFRNTISLIELKLYDGVKTIGKNAFQGSGLRKINLPDDVSITYDPFTGNGLEVLVKPGTRAYQWAVKYGYIHEENDLSSEGIEFDSVEAGVCYVSAYRGTAAHVIIPDTDEAGRPVVGIGPYAFNYNKTIETVKLPEGIKWIEEHAFFGCSNLRYVNLPDSIIGIGFAAFGGCSVLNNIILPQRLQIISQAAFMSCYSLRGIEIPASVTSIGPAAFQSCRELTVTSKGGYAQIGDLAFSVVPNVIAEQDSYFAHAVSKARSYFTPPGKNYKMKYLYSGDTLTGLELIVSRNATIFTVPEGVTSVWCEPDSILQDIHFSNTVKSISNIGFSGCGNLNRVEFPEGMREICSQAFYNCGKLSDVKINEGLEIIGNSAFWRCYKLESVYIPASVEEIESYAFGYSGLKTITIAGRTTKLGQDIFRSCTNLETIYAVKNSTPWKWCVENGLESKLADILDVLYLPDKADAYSEWWDNNIAGLYQSYMTASYRTGTGGSDSNMMLSDIAAFVDGLKDEHYADANRWKERYNTEDNFWLLDDDARLRLTLDNIAKTMIEDDSVYNLVVKPDLSNVSLTSYANQQVSLGDNKLNRTVDSVSFAYNGIKIAIKIAEIVTGTEGAVETGKQVAKAVGGTLISIAEDLVEEAKESIADALAEYDAALILDAYCAEYVKALKQTCSNYVDDLEDTYFGTIKSFEKGENDYYTQVVSMYIDSFRKADRNEDKLKEIARNTILSGTGYTYEDVKRNEEAITAWGNEMGQKFWLELLIFTAKETFKTLLTENFSKLPENQVDLIVDELIVLKVNNDLSVEFSVDGDRIVEVFTEIGVEDVVGALLGAADTFIKNAKYQNAKQSIDNAILGKSTTSELTNTLGGQVLKNIMLVEEVKDIAEMVWNFGKSIIYIAHDMIELVEIGDNQAIYDQYGCALIDAFGQRLNMRAKGELVYGTTMEQMVAWSSQTKEAHRRAFVSLLNIDEYIVLMYKSMKQIDETSNHRLAAHVTWLSDAEIEQKIITIRNAREWIRNVPEELEIYSSVEIFQ